MDKPDESYTEPVLDSDLPTFADLMEAAANRFPDQEAYVHGADRLSYGDWYDQSLRVAAGFSELGAKPGDIILIAIENSTDFAVCFAAAQLIGGIASGINTRLGQREVEGIVGKTGAAILILEDDAQAPPGSHRVIRCSDLAPLRAGRDKATPHQGKPDDLAVIIWTSGTTGMPKGAMFTHDNLRTAIRTAGPLAAPFARKVSATPFAHAGYGGKVWEQVAYAMTMVIAPTPWKAREMLQLLERERVGITGGGPTQWAKLLELPELADADLSELKVGISAMAPTPPELIEEVTRRIGIPLIVRYSMTECPSVTGTRIDDSPETKYRTVGKPQPGVRVKLLDERGEEVPSGEVGRIAVHSPGVTVGYWNDPDQTAQILIGDGWLLTSDLGRFDEDGNLVIAGRKSEMYIRGGYNVYPAEVERVLSELPSVAAVAIVGRATPTIGEIGVAFVVPQDPGSPPTLDNLKDKVRQELADYKAPDVMVLLDALPLTPVMKIDKEALKEQAAKLEETR